MPLISGRSAAEDEVMPSTRIVNALSFDIEDWFQVSNFERIVSRDSWPRHDSRVERNTETILEILDKNGVKATFFVLGWVAERFPGLVKRIADQGHEIGTHSHLHRLVYTLSEDEFRDDLARSIAELEDAAGTKIIGHRAPSFSIVDRSYWALDIMAEHGLRYDSSIYPIRHHRYGVPDAPREPYEIRPGLLEFPMATARFFSTNLPIAGGGYFRLYPYALTRWGIRRLNAESKPAMVYLHPWEFDPEQPRLAAPLLAKFRHYVGIARTAGRLDRLCRDFEFVPIRELLDLHTKEKEAVVR